MVDSMIGLLAKFIL
uniref:Uncharacterized protein n=1 Tax=Lepeophtheirus salmonis TaxID=72036 RepID=A0A0K2SZW9_LEPSM